MSKIFTSIRNLFRFHKLKMLGVVLFALLFTFFLFPYEDLADLATAKVSQITNNQVYLQSDTLDLGFIPISVSMDKVLVETPTLPAVKADYLSVSPWISGLIIGKQGASIDAKKLFGGAVAIDFHEGDKLKSGERMKNLGVDATGLKLPEVSSFLRDGGLASFLLQGTLGLKTQMQIDPNFRFPTVRRRRSRH